MVCHWQYHLWERQQVDIVITTYYKCGISCFLPIFDLWKSLEHISPSLPDYYIRTLPVSV